MAAPPARHSSDTISPTGRVRALLLITSTAGGAGLHALYLARHLPRQQFDLTVAFGPGYPLDAQFAELNLPVVHLPLSRSIAPVANTRAAFQLWRLLRTQPFDLIIAACSIAGVLGRVLGWASGTPRRVYILHAFASHPHQPLLKRAVYRMVERAMDRFTTHYYAVSAAMRDFGVQARIFPAEKATVVHNGIPLPQPADEPPARVRAALGIPATAPLIVTAGRLERQKGLVYLLDALAQIRVELPAARCLIVGDGPLRSSLEARAASLGLGDAVHFAGWRTDVAQLVQASDVFCLPSLWESFGLVLVEAMALGKPIVASGVDGVPEVVAAGETGLLVPPGSPSALAAALLAVLRDPELGRRLGAAGQRRAVSNFALEPSIARYATELAAHVGAARHRRNQQSSAPARAPLPEVSGS